MSIQKQNLGYPRIGINRQLKKVCELYWAGKTDKKNLFMTAREVQEDNLKTQKQAGIDLIPCNDFSFYDHVLDMTLQLGAIPQRFNQILTGIKDNAEIDLYFAMARGYQKDGLDIIPMEMTKWFDTNYHYIVPEFTADQAFSMFSSKIISEFNYARIFLNRIPKPVLIGPVSFLMLGKEKEKGFDKLDLIEKLVPVYIEILAKLKDYGAVWVQMDEPFLTMDLSDKEKNAFTYAYHKIKKEVPGIRLMLTTYFSGLEDNSRFIAKLPVSGLHIDLTRDEKQLEQVLKVIPDYMSLSLGVVDGRNIWKNDYYKSLKHIEKAITELGENRVIIAPGCSLMHVPLDLEQENEIPAEIKSWMAFAGQKLRELNELAEIISGNDELLKKNQEAVKNRKVSNLVNNQAVTERIASVNETYFNRSSIFAERRLYQQEKLNLPLFPTTTIGSFPQTPEVRKIRSKWKKGLITGEQYEDEIKNLISQAMEKQEQIGLDVLVHGEFERNDMVEYFGEQLNGFLFTSNGWIQSYGSRCVKPPVIYGDISRENDMTVKWSCFAQSKTEKPVKGMLTGPVTILQWSFVRDDQPRSLTARQIALVIRDEAAALEKAGIKIIQIDEPAIREGLPLRKSQWDDYLDWAVNSFRLASSGVKNETQIHTHMCYSEFNDIIRHIAALDADVITIEASRSRMELLESFIDFRYPNKIGPGVYDIHSPRIPSEEDIISLLEKITNFIPVENIWVNPDCGLKTRDWSETEASLKNMVSAARVSRKKFVPAYAV